MIRCVESTQERAQPTRAAGRCATFQRSRNRQATALPVLLLLFGWAPAMAAESQPGAASSEIVDSIGMRLVLVPAGEFTMGGQESAEELVQAFQAYHRRPEYFADEYPSHRVRITHPFYLGKCEVTVGQFGRFVLATGYRTEAETDGQGGWGFNAVLGKCEGRRPQFNWRNPGFPQTDDHPVINVSWNDAVAFCRWLSQVEQQTYRLPTEAEWEYACRAGSRRRYWFGNDPDDLAERSNTLDARGRTEFPHVQDVMAPQGAKLRFTMPVGRFAPNAFGLYDMHGNVWEWCADWHADDYYSRSPLEDPKGPESGEVRVRRGGGWNSFPLWARASFRNWNTPQSRCVNLGFRVARRP